jgi:diguanylate cyclase (GGDEF)-like protein/PAS domain S-box-containing protein
MGSMSEGMTSEGGHAGESLRSEVVRLNKIIRALMDRAERSTNVQGSDFSLFQTTIMLQEEVRRRTAELEAALRLNETTNRALRESEARFRGVVSQSLVGIAIVEDGRVSYANPQFAEMFGYSCEEVGQREVLELVEERDRELVAKQLQSRLNREVEGVDYVFRGQRKDGVVGDIECHSSVMDMGGKVVLIDLVLDITERIRAEREVRALQDQLREQAIHDPLTGLYNRQSLNEFFDRELNLAARRGESISAVMADLDHFKAVNDTYGHQAGDEVLRKFAEFIQHAHRVSDVFCRYGGEEFLLVLPTMENETACHRIEQLRRVVESTPVVVGPSAIRVTASFGIATFPQHGETREALLAAADSALYAAKDAGRNQVKSYTKSMGQKMRRAAKSGR